MESKLSGTAFWVKDLWMNRSTFSGAPVHVGVASMLRRTVEGHATSLNRRQAMEAAFSELVERYSFMARSPVVRGYAVPAYNLATGAEVELPLDRVMYGDPRTMFPPGEDRKYFNDSVGAASHRGSDALIRSAWLEFVERQSLVYNWLTQSPGTVIDRAGLGPDVAITLSKLNQYFSDLRIYDISLHGDVCVAAIVGFGDLFMGIGVAAHWRTEDAVKSAARECLSHVQMYSPWDSGASLDEHYRRDVGALENSYSRNYFKSYDPDTLRNAYRYLEASVPSSRHDAEVPQDLGALMERIGKVSSDLHIEPLIARLPTPIDLLMFKTAKILALEAYPHMNCAEFDPEEYAISYHRGDVTFPNRGIMIPFP